MALDQKSRIALVDRLCLDYKIERTDPIAGVMHALCDLTTSTANPLDPGLKESFKLMAENAGVFRETIETQKVVAGALQSQLKWIKSTFSVLATIYLAAGIPVGYAIKCVLDYLENKPDAVFQSRTGSDGKAAYFLPQINLGSVQRDQTGLWIEVK